MCFKAECLIKEEKPPFDLSLDSSGHNDFEMSHKSSAFLLWDQNYQCNLWTQSQDLKLVHLLFQLFFTLTSDYVFYMFTCLQRPTENLNANTGARSWLLELIYLLIFLFFCEASDTWFLGYVYLVFNFYTETVIVSVLMKRWKSVGISPTCVISAATGSQALEVKVSFCFDYCLSSRLFEDAALISDWSQRIKF